MLAALNSTPACFLFKISTILLPCPAGAWQSREGRAVTLSTLGVIWLSVFGVSWSFHGIITDPFCQHQNAFPDILVTCNASSSLQLVFLSNHKAKDKCHSIIIRERSTSMGESGFMALGVGQSSSSRSLLLPGLRARLQCPLGHIPSLLWSWE